MELIFLSSSRYLSIIFPKLRISIAKKTMEIQNESFNCRCLLKFDMKNIFLIFQFWFVIVIIFCFVFFFSFVTLYFIIILYECFTIYHLIFEGKYLAVYLAWIKAKMELVCYGGLRYILTICSYIKIRDIKFHPKNNITITGYKQWKTMHGYI